MPQDVAERLIQGGSRGFLFVCGRKSGAGGQEGRAPGGSTPFLPFPNGSLWQEIFGICSTEMHNCCMQYEREGKQMRNIDDVEGNLNVSDFDGFTGDLIFASSEFRDGCVKGLNILSTKTRASNTRSARPPLPPPS